MIKLNVVMKDINRKKHRQQSADGGGMEASTRFELVNQGFADPCLTTWLRRRIKLYAK